MRTPASCILHHALFSFLCTTTLLAQDARQTGLGWSALPAFNYDSDEGYGYGVAGGLYQYGDGSRDPYIWSLEPVVFFTSNGRRSVGAFFDAPYLINPAVRLTVWAGYDGDCCQPYYGFGNATQYDTGILAGQPIYYTYNRKRVFGIADLQWRVLPKFRVLTGVAYVHNITGARDPQTLYAEDAANGIIPATDSSYNSWGPKVGVIFDTRDVERDPRTGVWLDALGWFGVGVLGGSSSFNRLSTTLRGYFSPVEWATFAGRVIAENITGDMPQPMLNDLGSSFQDFSGLGGAETIRGVFRQRFLGGTRAMGNFEVRVRGPRFDFLGAPWRLAAVGFVDAGRVWDDRGFGNGDVGLHVGKGAGFRVHWGNSFIIAGDFGHERDAGWQTYLRLGHLF